MAENHENHEYYDPVNFDDETLNMLLGKGIEYSPSPPNTNVSETDNKNNTVKNEKHTNMSQKGNILPQKQQKVKKVKKVKNVSRVKIEKAYITPPSSDDENDENNQPDYDTPTESEESEETQTESEESESEESEPEPQPIPRKKNAKNVKIQAPRQHRQPKPRKQKQRRATRYPSHYQIAPEPHHNRFGVDLDSIW